MERLFGEHIQVMDKVLDLRLQRQNVVMSNIANVTTRGVAPISTGHPANDRR